MGGIRLCFKHVRTPLQHVAVHKAPWTALQSGSPSTDVCKGFETTTGYPPRAFFVRRNLILQRGEGSLVKPCGQILKKVLAVLACRLYNTHIAPVAQWIEQWPPEPCAGVRFPSGARERQDQFLAFLFPILKDSCLCELV